MFAPIHLTCPADVADALREVQLRLRVLRERAPITFSCAIPVEEFLAQLEEAVLEHEEQAAAEVTRGTKKSATRPKK